ncbi:MAG: hypothetical protein RMJ33_05115 [Saprospiraceae bacterium]|nr:hypothetical protein [Saprospiraceae bacterium]MDW8229201.1 hypothetical protein [Saprospiraceae bacterium]
MARHTRLGFKGKHRNAEANAPMKPILINHEKINNKAAFYQNAALFTGFWIKRNTGLIQNSPIHKASRQTLVKGSANLCIEQKKTVAKWGFAHGQALN